MPERENSSDHQRAFNEWEMLEMILNKGKALDGKLQEQTMKERFGGKFEDGYLMSQSL